MTAEALEIKRKIDKRISILTPRQLNGLLSFLDSFVTSSQLLDEKSKQAASSRPHNAKFAGMKISDEVAALRMGYSIDVSDEDLDKMRYEYLIDKYK
jgi:hypothetical protein